MHKHTHTPFTAVVSIHPLRGRTFDNLPAALRYVGCLHHARFVCVEIRNGRTWQTSGPAVTVSQDIIDYAATHRKEA